MFSRLWAISISAQTRWFNSSAENSIPEPYGRPVCFAVSSCFVVDEACRRSRAKRREGRSGAKPAREKPARSEPAREVKGTDVKVHIYIAQCSYSGSPACCQCSRTSRRSIPTTQPSSACAEHARATRLQQAAAAAGAHSDRLCRTRTHAPTLRGHASRGHG